MSKKTIASIGDKLTKVSDTFTVNMYDNGFMLEIGGRDRDNEWKNCKIMVQTIEQLQALVREAAELPRDE